MTDLEKLEAIRAWLHPGLWSGLDGRRSAIESILDGKEALPPEWVRGG